MTLVRAIRESQRADPLLGTGYSICPLYSVGAFEAYSVCCDADFLWDDVRLVAEGA